MMAIGCASRVGTCPKISGPGCSFPSEPEREATAPSVPDELQTPLQLGPEANFFLRPLHARPLSIDN